MIRIDPTFARRLQRLSMACAVLAALIAMVGLSGWVLHLPRLTYLMVGLATMKVNTSFCLLACAAAMILRGRVAPRSPLDRIADGLALFAIGVGLLTLLQYAIGRNIGIDNLLIQDPSMPLHGHPGRMSIATASSITLIAIGIFLLDRATRTSQAIAIGGLLIAMLALLVYLYNIESLYNSYPFSSMALNTAAALSLLAISHLTARSRRCLHHLLISNTIGGSVTRRLLPAIVLVPLAIGWLRLQGQRLGFYDTPFGIGIFALSTIVILAVIVWRNATLLDRTEADRRRIEADRDDLLEREQHARARAEKALTARDQLLAIVSHELRAPLTPALLVATALEHRAQLPADVQEDLHLIHEQIEIEARLIDNLLDMASLNQGKLALKRQPIDLHDIARAVAAAVDEQVIEQGVSLNLDLQCKSPQVLADPQRLTQVLSNLVGNAIKFSTAGGHVRLRTSDASDDRIMLEIIDSGVGIEPAVLERLFNPFEQADPSTTRRFGGMGIGLAISKMLIQLHGGTLNATSEGVSKGATFIITLPRQITPAKIDQSIGQPFSRRSILLVDDNAQILWAMERLIRSKGYDVIAVATGEDALAVARSKPFDLLVSDISLPDLSGWELLRQLREIRPTQGIAISGFIDADDRAKSLASGYRLHLAKPIDVEQLLAAIETALSNADNVTRSPAVVAAQ